MSLNWIDLVAIVPFIASVLATVALDVVFK